MSQTLKLKAITKSTNEKSSSVRFASDIKTEVQGQQAVQTAAAVVTIQYQDPFAVDEFKVGSEYTVTIQ